jgi:hypothetical protein
MFQGPPLPLSPDLPLSTLLSIATAAEPLGAWVRAAKRQLQLYRVPARISLGVLVSPDLGFLLGRCARVALRAGEHTVVLRTDAVIQWRALQVVTATPYLSGLERFQGLFPGMQATANGFVVPLMGESPEAVLAGCAAQKIAVVASEVVYCRVRAPTSNLPPLPQQS